jgi:hypothetical protein
MLWLPVDFGGDCGVVRLLADRVEMRSAIAAILNQ